MSTILDASKIASFDQTMAPLYPAAHVLRCLLYCVSPLLGTFYELSNPPPCNLTWFWYSTALQLVPSHRIILRSQNMTISETDTRSHLPWVLCQHGSRSVNQRTMQMRVILNLKFKWFPSLGHGHYQTIGINVKVAHASSESLFYM